jgi:inward rectifier potassium channel
MAMRRRGGFSINSRAKSEDNSGFGTNSSLSGGRFINSDGKPNVSKRGIGLLERYSLYHSFLAMPRWKFLLCLLSVYVMVNLFFGTVYFLIGVNNLSGASSGNPWMSFAEAFFFSAQTFTTVGYGRISPTGILASSIAAVEAFIGLLSFAIATGLFYGRFSRPKAYLRFSEIAILAPYRSITALMFRMAPFKNINLLEAETRVTLAMKVEENGQLTNKFYNLVLELSRVNTLTASWTIVHPIDEKSPLYNLDREDYRNGQAEIIAFVKAFDDTYSNTVTAIKSYVVEEIVFGARFKVMYQPSPDKRRTLLFLNRINEIDLTPLPELVRSADQPAAGTG